MDVLPGPAHDAPHLVRMLDRPLGRVPAVNEVVGDRGFDGDRLREACRETDVTPAIPVRANRDPDRWAWYQDGYRERDRVARRFGEAEPFRRIATRSDALEATDLGVLHRVLGFIRRRAETNGNTP